MTDDQVKIKTRFFPLDHEVAAAKLAALTAHASKVHLDGRIGFRRRSHVRLYQDAGGHFVRLGIGGSKEYLGRCKAVWLGDEVNPTLVMFTLRTNDEADAAYKARLDAMYEARA